MGRSDGGLPRGTLPTIGYDEDETSVVCDVEDWYMPPLVAIGVVIEVSYPLV